MNHAGMVAITIHDVPVETRNELASRPARSGRSLQEYLREHLIALAERDNVRVLARMRERAERAGVRLSAEEIVDAVHADRPMA